MFPAMTFITERFTYDLFLSFRGEDTRYGFTGYLWKALRDKGIHTFIDDEELQKGDEITPSLVKAIEQSQMAIIVLSKNYASSSFCLEELSNIIDSIKNKGRFVWPVFYKVDPSDVRKLTGTYGDAMAIHEVRFNHNMGLIQKWKNALYQVANLSGFHYKKGDGYKYEFIGKIVGRVSTEIKPVALPVADYLVGLEFQMQNVRLLLNVGSDDRVHMVGIHGIGGIGKTTVALAVYNLVAHQFQASCFLEKVRENSDKHGLKYLQNNLLSQIVGDKKIKVKSVKQGMSIIQQRLRQKKVLLLLDDVDKEEQLHAIAGKTDWFGLGSRILITTRDNGLLKCHGVESTYDVKELNRKDAFELFRQKAFKTVQVCSDYANVVNRAVTYASGLPLALEVIGSHLFNKTVEQCISALDRYERIPDKKIQTILLVSFDSLDEEERRVFLDIACCFRGYKLADVEKILHAHHGNSKKDHIIGLAEKSLIKISESSQVTLHDLIVDMGKEIVRQESPSEPGKRSRLWSPTDIAHVLEGNTGTGKIEIISLDSRIEVKWDGEAMKKMENLKTLIIRSDYYLPRSPIHLPNSLKVLKWEAYPLENLPHDFYPKKLVICNLAFSNFNSLVLRDLFNKKFENMRALKLDDCKFLKQIPNVSGLPNLEELSFQFCSYLLEIDESVGLLEKLQILSANDCWGLTSFPPLKLASLEQLYLSNCSNLESFPIVVDGCLDKLKILSVKGCSKLKSIPRLKLASLEQLDISSCVSLESFAPVDGLLDKLKLWSANNCKKIRTFPSLKLASLEQLDLSYCNSLESFLPVDGLMDKLKTLDVKGCIRLRNFPPLKLASLEQIDLSYCVSLETFAPVDGLLDKLIILRANNCKKLGVFSTLKLASLERLDLSYCASLACFPPLDGLLGKLQILSVKGCSKLRSIPPLLLVSLEQLDFSYCVSLESFAPMDGLLSKLKILCFKCCSKLKSIPPLKLASLEQLDISYCVSLESFTLLDGLLDKLKILTAKHCKKLRSFPPLKLASLEQLDMSYCVSLEHFPLVDGLLGKLKILSVEGCSKLSSIPPLKFASLQHLNLSYCDRLESFAPMDGLLDKLKILSVDNCKKLRSFPPLNLACLEQLTISYCASLEGFPRVDGLLGRLQILSFKGCSKLRSIPPFRLALLQQLDLSYCGSLESFEPVDGLLDKLKILSAINCEKLKSFPSLKLASLEQLDLSYCFSLENFPTPDGLCKLKILSFKGCNKLRSIPPLMLASLEQLDLSYCVNLESFPIDGLLDKLQILNAEHCEKLRNFPQLKLASLEQLNLSYCVSLECFPPVVGMLDKLKMLNLKGCSNLKSIPPLKLALIEHLDISSCVSLEGFPKIL